MYLCCTCVIRTEKTPEAEHRTNSLIQLRLIHVSDEQRIPFHTVDMCFHICSFVDVVMTVQWIVRVVRCVIAWTKAENMFCYPAVMTAIRVCGHQDWWYQGDIITREPGRVRKVMELTSSF